MLASSNSVAWPRLTRCVEAQPTHPWLWSWVLLACSAVSATVNIAANGRRSHLSTGRAIAGAAKVAAWHLERHLIHSRDRPQAPIASQRGLARKKAHGVAYTRLVSQCQGKRHISHWRIRRQYYRPSALIHFPKLDSSPSAP